MRGLPALLRAVPAPFRRPRRPGDEAAAPPPSPQTLMEMVSSLPPELLQRALTHSSWVGARTGSYERLEFLGDSVLSLAVSTHLYPRLEAERFGAGRLTKIRAQAVSGVSCRAVAERLGVKLPEPGTLPN